MNYNKYPSETEYISWFCSKYHVAAAFSQNKLYNTAMYNGLYNTASQQAMYRSKIETAWTSKIETAWTVEISHENFVRMARESFDADQERRIRTAHSSVRAAWEQYQMMLNLVASDYEY